MENILFFKNKTYQSTAKHPEILPTFYPPLMWGMLDSRAEKIKVEIGNE